jgi:hypothetical protein
MAIATATALALGSIAVSAGSAGMSFGQARQQKKLGEQAKEDARKAMAEARKALEVNYYDQLAVQKEPYELQREAMLAQGALATQAGVEGDRGAAATAGRVQAAMNDAQAEIRTGMGKELTDLAKLSAEEDARNRDIGIQLDLEDVAGAQQAASDAAVARSQAIAAGVQSAGNAVQGAIQLAPLYGQKLNAQKAATYTALGKDDPSMIDLRRHTYQGKELGLIDYNAMSNREFRGFKNALSPEQKMQLFQSQPYLQSYNPNPFEIQ